MYISQWVEIGGILYAEMEVESDEIEIENNNLDNLDFATNYFYAGWFDALFTEALPEKLESDFIFDYLCGWYAQKYELEVALKHCQEGEF